MRDTLRITFESFVKFYGDRNDYEVILVESKSNVDNEVEHSKFLSIINDFRDKITIRNYQNNDSSYSCSKGYNLAFYESVGDFVIITNPESPHTCDILKEFDNIFSKNNDSYIVCGCEAVNVDGNHYSWYQHSLHSNRNLHFCSSLSKKNWLKINGFCESYRKGCAYEDDDFLARVKALGIPIVVRDDLLVLHIEHDRSYVSMEMENINKKLFNFIWDKDR